MTKRKKQKYRDKYNISDNTPQSIGQNNTLGQKAPSLVKSSISVKKYKEVIEEKKKGTIGELKTLSKPTVFYPQATKLFSKASNIYNGIFGKQKFKAQRSSIEKDEYKLGIEMEGQLISRLSMERILKKHEELNLIALEVKNREIGLLKTKILLKEQEILKLKEIINKHNN